MNTAFTLAESRTIQLRPDGVVREVRVDAYARENLTIELARRPMLVKKGMEAGIFLVHDVFADPSNEVLVADVEIRMVGRIHEEESGVAKATTTSVVTGPQPTNAVERGAPVLVRPRLRCGRQLVVLVGDSVPKTMFVESFDQSESLGTFWKFPPGAAAIQDGRLTVRPDRKSSREGTSTRGELEIYLFMMASQSSTPFDLGDLCDEGMGLRFGLQQRKGAMVAFARRTRGDERAPVEFVIGRYKDRRPGIYVDGEPVATMDGTHMVADDVALGFSPQGAELRIGAASCRARFRDRLEIGHFGVALYHAEDEFSMDDFRITKWALRGDDGDGEARVLACSPITRRFLFRRPEDLNWRGDLNGTGLRLAGGSNGTIQAGVCASIGEYLVCAVPAQSKEAVACGMSVARDSSFRLDPDSARALEQRSADVSARRSDKAADSATRDLFERDMVPERDSALRTGLLAGDRALKPLKAADTSSVTFVTAEAVEPLDAGMRLRCLSGNATFTEGYVHPIVRSLVHPVSGEVMGGVVGEPVSCRFIHDGAQMEVRPVGDRGPRDESAKTGIFLVCRSPMPAGACVESAGAVRRSDSDSGKTPFWEQVNGRWHVRNGRLVSPSPEGGGAPMLLVRKETEGNMQFDFDVVVEKVVVQNICIYVKDISCMFFSPRTKVGVTIGLGVEGAGGIAIDRGAPGGVNLGGLPDRKDTKGVGFKGHDRYEGPKIEAKVGRRYAVTFRRIGEDFVMYVDNRRAIVLPFKGLDGPIQTWLLAPESILSVGDARIMSLPADIPHVGKAEALLGERGYVLASTGSTAYVDADYFAPGAAKTVSVVKPVGAMQSRKDGTVLSMDFVCLGTASVEAVGDRVAAIRLAYGMKGVERGMRVLYGRYPARFQLTPAELRDIDSAPR